MYKIFAKRRELLENPKRIHSLDYWRAVAILSVVFFHAGFLPYGYLGVDLFFVLSGYLVSRVLVDSIEMIDLRRVKNFIISRSFKIWPSFFAFLLVGNIFAALLYGQSHPELVIHGTSWFKYLFFYLNYRSTDHHIFDHLWSLCVEEHFYLLLPFGLLIWRRNFVFLSLTQALLVVILLGNGMRLLSYLIHFETMAATHNRIDALTYGVLLYVLESRGIVARWNSLKLFWVGILCFVAVLTFHSFFSNTFFQKVIFHGVVPPILFLLLGSSLRYRANFLDWLKYISYYSYNWYLWHQLLYFKLIVDERFSAVGICIYLVAGFFLAIFATHLVEEPGLLLRKLWRSRQ